MFSKRRVVCVCAAPLELFLMRAVKSQETDCRTFTGGRLYCSQGCDKSELEKGCCSIVARKLPSSWGGACSARSTAWWNIQTARTPPLSRFCIWNCFVCLACISPGVSHRSWNRCRISATRPNKNKLSVGVYHESEPRTPANCVLMQLHFGADAPVAYICSVVWPDFCRFRRPAVQPRLALGRWW